MPDRKVFDAWAMANRLSPKLKRIVWNACLEWDLTHGETFDDVLRMLQVGNPPTANAWY